MLSFLSGMDPADVGGTRTIASMRAATLETKLLSERAEPSIMNLLIEMPLKSGLPLGCSIILKCT